ncbi:DNRLRE domain-containing protein [Micromonospora sp. ATCC 39149]|uniref:DNRLRE domain-containing protein n=1 Tax=Micromonospora carbonacea TaxID=47853 RepID=A0A7D6C7W0_9ACTN|nr:DNRLRE domain-containing protein [Micromonospora sp. ATCC 39149]QLK00545.1 DNRLRE domain-containing protein [Micromonospora carbonacea]
MRTLRAFLLVVAVLAATLVTPAPAQAVTTHIYPATRDTYVKASSPNTNYNSQRQLVVAGSPDRISYLAFAVTGLTEPILHATLRMKTLDTSNAGSTDGGRVFPVGSSWSETTLTYATRPAPIGPSVTPIERVKPDTIHDIDVTDAIRGNGVVSFGIFSNHTDGAYYHSRENNEAAGPALLVYTGVPSTDDTVILAAGDIADCRTERDEQTAKILDTEVGVVAAIGDTAYEKGAPEEYAACYAPTWGRHKSRTRPAVGNHEYLTPNAAGYFGYFGAAAGPPGQGWYSYNMAGGQWHVVVLNSNCAKIGGCHAGSPQERWLRADLAASKARCTVAYWHQPLFASGGRGSSAYRPLFQALYDAGVEVLLNAHNHQYERFAPQTPTGAADPDRGVRQFIIGTGGRSLQPDFPTVAANSEVRNGNVFGVLRLTLLPGEYRWRFVPVAGQTFNEVGTGLCH